MASASHLERFLHSVTPSEYFYCLAGNDDSNTTNYAESPHDHVVKFGNRFRGLIETGHCYEPTLQGLTTDLKSDGSTSLEFRLSSADSIRSSRTNASLDAHGLALSTLPEFYPSLESKYGRGRQDASLVPWDARPPKLLQLAEPTLLNSICQVLSLDPSYAEDVIRAVNHLPHDKRSRLFEPETEPADDPGSSNSSAGPSKKRQRPSTNDSNGRGGRAGRGTGRGRGGRGAGDKDDGGNEDGGSGGGGRSQPTKDLNMDKHRRWICPYSIAYPDLCENPMFSHCWPGNMTEVHLWKDHLEKHHSPIAPNADLFSEGDAARFYMDPGQWVKVCKQINEKCKKRPRAQDEWFSHWEDLFRKVWSIIFPTDEFPDLNGPCSPFHLNSAEMAKLADHAKIMLKSIREVRANRAVASKEIASTEDFRPSDADMDEMMSQAMSITLLRAPVAHAATNWLAHASPQTLQATSADHTGIAESHPGTAPHDVPSEMNAQRPATAPRTSDSAPIDLTAAQTVSPVSFTVPVTLFPHGTQVTMNLLPTNNWNLQTDAQTGQLQLALPTSFYTTNFNQAPLSMPPTMFTPNIPANVTRPAMGLDTGIDQRQPTEPPGSQGVSMQDIQEGPLGPEELALVNNIGSMGQLPSFVCSRGGPEG